MQKRINILKSKSVCVPVCATVSVAVSVRLPSRVPPGEPTPLQSCCAGLSRGNFRVGGGFVCTGRCLGGGMEGRVISPPSSFLLGH